MTSFPLFCKFSEKIRVKLKNAHTSPILYINILYYNARENTTPFLKKDLQDRGKPIIMEGKGHKLLQKLGKGHLEMKKIVGILLVLLCLAAPLTAVRAAEGFRYTLQPQNLQYPQNAVAIYSVEVTGVAGTPMGTWFLKWNGVTYDLSKANGSQPWEAYAGSEYGPRANGNVLTYVFQGIETGLDGAEIWCVAEDGHNDMESAHAVVTVSEGAKMPAQLRVPAEIRADKGEEIDLRCEATSPRENVQLTYTWYETSTGRLQDVKALPGSDGFSDYITLDTSKPGTRYYVCGVFTSEGGVAYSSVVPVTVSEGPGPGQPDPAIVTPSLPDAFEGRPYQTRLEANGDGFTFSESYNPGGKNELEASGLTLSENGVLSGTPAAAGTYTFSVCATSSAGDAYATFTLTVKPASEEPPKTEPPRTGEPPVDARPGEERPGSSDPDALAETIAKNSSASSSGLSLWAVVLIGVGCALVGGAVVALVLYFVLRKKK